MYLIRKLCNILNKQKNRTNSNGTIANTQAPHKAPDEIEEESIENRVMDELTFEDEFKITFDEESQILPVNLIETEEDLPNFYVDSNLLEHYFETSSNRAVEQRLFVYNINGVEFEEVVNKNEVHSEAEKLLEFEILDRILDKDNDDNSLEAENVSIQRNDFIETNIHTDTLDFPIAIQNTRYGLILNSNLILTENGWNTIVCGDPTICVACDKILDLRDIKNHTATVNHKDSLNKYKPLQKFDMNIVRKIRDKYHCAICNVTFSDGTDHVDTLVHGQNMLTSINKVCDITKDDFDICRNENKSRGDGIDSGSIDGFNDDVTIEYCNDSKVEYKERNDEKLFSYADVAKKPKKFTNSNYVQIRLGEKDAKVTYDTWHMIIILKNNLYYCMACKNNGPIRYKSDHCVELSHVENLMRCKIVLEYKEHVIRKIDDKFYHCGHCNSLKMMHEIRNHIEAAHVKRNVITNKNLSETDLLTNSKTDNNNTKTSSSATVKSAKVIPVDIAYNDCNIAENISKGIYMEAVTSHDSRMDDNIKNVKHTAINPHNNVGNVPNFPYNQAISALHIPFVLPVEPTILLKEFGHTFRIPLLAFHLIQQRGPQAFFCLVCETFCTNNVGDHSLAPVHTTKIRNMPFLPQTTFHLIRHTKYGFHCTVCNCIINIDPIYHTWEPMHLALLQKVLCVNSVPPMVNSPLGSPDLYKTNIATLDDRPNQMFQHKLETNEDEDRLAQKKLENRNDVTLITTTKGNIEREIRREIQKNEVNEETKANVEGRKVKENKLRSGTEKTNFEIKKDVREEFQKKKVQGETKVSVVKGEIDENKITSDTEKEYDLDKEVKKEIKTNEMKGDTKAIVERREIEENKKGGETMKENFNVEEYVYVKIKNNYTKIKMTSYNSLVQTGSGTRYCVLCSKEVFFQGLKAHISNEGHLQNMEQFKFLEKYEKHLLRQTTTFYHCALCNVAISKGFLNNHLLWPPHKYSEANKIVKHIRRTEIKSGVKQIYCSTQKENLSDDMHVEFKILDNIEFRPHAHRDVIKRNKIVVIDNAVLKLSWDAFHGICVRKNCYRCIICQADFKSYELSTHTESSRHEQLLENCFRLEFSPALIRKVNISSVHCLTCNLVVNNEDHVIKDHIESKRHKKMYTKVVADKTVLDTSDNADVLVLK